MLKEMATHRIGYAVTQLTIGNILRDKAATCGQSLFLSYLPDGRTYTFSDIDRLSNVIANGLLRLGLKPGDHVAVMMANRPEQLLLFFALGKIGVIAVPINIAARGQLLQYYLAQSDSIALVVEESLLPQLNDIRESLHKMSNLVVFPSHSGPPLELPASNSFATLPLTSFATLLDAPDKAPDVPVKFSDLALLLYTSGTTGPSKAVMFTHAYALLYGIDQVENYGILTTDIVYVCTPLFHAHGLLSHTYGPLVLGARVALSQRFSASNFWKEVRESGATVLSMLGSMANILWSRPPAESDTRHNVRQATIAPSPSAGVLFEQRFGFQILGAYGLTDYGMGTVFSLKDPRHKLGSAGRPRPGMQVRIVDDNDLPMSAREVGEIVMRSDLPWNTSSGYYRMPEATLAARRNLWFHTGDRGYFDSDGYLYFGDRKKDSIRRRGENISAFEIEQIISNHAAVSDVAVFAASSSLGEDEVACAVVLRDGRKLFETELINYCQSNLPYFMVPRYVRFVADLPRSATHKVEKYKLQKDVEANLASYWDREKAGIVLRRN